LQEGENSRISPSVYTQTVNLEITYSYDTEGKLTSLVYPTERLEDPAYPGQYRYLSTPTTGLTYNYTYDSLGRPVAMSSPTTNWGQISLFFIFFCYSGAEFMGRLNGGWGRGWGQISFFCVRKIGRNRKEDGKGRKITYDIFRKLKI
jgi:YD repeat-containing protein